jgi:hypothetical protein
MAVECLAPLTGRGRFTPFPGNGRGKRSRAGSCLESVGRHPRDRAFTSAENRLKPPSVDARARHAQRPGQLELQRQWPPGARRRQGKAAKLTMPFLNSANGLMLQRERQENQVAVGSQLFFHADGKRVGGGPQRPQRSVDTQGRGRVALTLHRQHGPSLAAPPSAASLGRLAEPVRRGPRRTGGAIPSSLTDLPHSGFTTRTSPHAPRTERHTGAAVHP